MTDYAEMRAALEAAHELGENCFVSLNSADIRALLAERDDLREALTDLTSANDHVEYSRALARSRAALAQGEA